MYVLESKWEENLWFEEFKLSSTWYPFKKKKKNEKKEKRGILSRHLPTCGIMK